jgi:tRNA G18 (ribose-2'-O)-methylase SpoU
VTDHDRAPISIDDPADQRVADYVGLSDAQLRRRFEDPDGEASPRGRFITEGLLALEALARSPYPIRSVLVAGSQLDRVQSVIAAAQDGSPPIYVASQAVLDAVVGFSIHRGVVASCERLPLPDPLQLASDCRRIAVFEALNDHENLGVLFRNAAAFGLDAVLLDPRCADPLYRRCVRVSLGHALRVPFARFDAADWPGGLAALAARGFDVVALTPAPDAEPLHDLDVPKDRPIAFLLGAEGPGLSGDALRAATRRVRIAMAPGVDSLNVATAAAIAFHWFS